jgi:hypothetical protein
MKTAAMRSIDGCNADSNNRGLRLQPPEIIKNYVLGGLNIEKRQLCVKGFLSQGFRPGWGLFQLGFKQFP